LSSLTPLLWVPLLFHLPPPGTASRGKLTELLVREALAATNNNRLQAAKRLGVGRATLYRFLAKHPLA